MCDGNLVWPIVVVTNHSSTCGAHCQHVGRYPIGPRKHRIEHAPHNTRFTSLSRPTLPMVTTADCLRCTVKKSAVYMCRHMLARRQPVPAVQVRLVTVFFAHSEESFLCCIAKPCIRTVLYPQSPASVIGEALTAPFCRL